ncbi:metal-dependent hydrolase [Robiginitalea sp. M366]|uniref:metal-dependent hydrolase n=1 Tax=Robiginitalea aestuariiviva TaxID=3036903 RepID=UPI00240E08EA|nr:metal-dependent hydrolase [Robiginitalea aestuariiviva]MDG1573072.1 metal-dependent hydrolase [Robiginitalea aestuariiviva]
MEIVFLGHGSLQIRTADHELVVDPFITANELAKGKVSLNQLHPDFILLTHAHQDHILDVEALAKASGATLISNYEIITHYQGKGLDGHPMNHGGARDFPFGWLKYVNAVHTSSFPDGSYGGQPGGFVLNSGGKTVYIAGDTALHMDMKLIPMDGPVDLAVLPIGDNFTMGAKDAAQAARFVECPRAMGVHYDTFGYIEIDKEAAQAEFQKLGVELLLPEIGEGVTL